MVQNLFMTRYQRFCDKLQVRILERSTQIVLLLSGTYYGNAITIDGFYGAEPNTRRGLQIAVKFWGAANGCPRRQC